MAAPGPSNNTAVLPPRPYFSHCSTHSVPCLSGRGLGVFEPYHSTVSSSPTRTIQILQLNECDARQLCTLVVYYTAVRRRAHTFGVRCAVAVVDCELAELYVCCGRGQGLNAQATVAHVGGWWNTAWKTSRNARIRLSDRAKGRLGVRTLHLDRRSRLAQRVHTATMGSGRGGTPRVAAAGRRIRARSLLRGSTHVPRLSPCHGTSPSSHHAGQAHDGVYPYQGRPSPLNFLGRCCFRWCLTFFLHIILRTCCLCHAPAVCVVATTRTISATPFASRL